MVIVAGHVTVEPRQREAYLAGCVSIVKRSRSLDGCLDFAITADPIDPGRVNIYECWESQAALESARSSAPGDDLGAAMLSVSVAEYDIADVRPLFGGARHEPPARTGPRPTRSVRHAGPTERREGNPL